MRSPDDKNRALRALHDQYRDCARCPLSQPAGRRRQHVVYGIGNPSARVMIVGEAPGYHEDLYGQPFVGESGALLDDFLAGCRSSRDEVFITNTVLCRPTEENNPKANRAPLKPEIQACRARLDAEIEIVDPFVLILLGSIPFKLLTDEPRPITQVARDATLPMLWATTQGQFVPVRRSAYVAFHPSYLLRLRQEHGDEKFFSNGSDAHRTFLTFRQAFRAADTHAFMKFGTPIPDRGDD